MKVNVIVAGCIPLVHDICEVILFILGTSHHNEAFPFHSALHGSCPDEWEM